MPGRPGVERFIASSTVIGTNPIDIVPLDSNHLPARVLPAVGPLDQITIDLFDPGARGRIEGAHLLIGGRRLAADAIPLVCPPGVVPQFAADADAANGLVVIRGSIQRAPRRTIRAANERARRLANNTPDQVATR